MIRRDSVEKLGEALRTTQGDEFALAPAVGLGFGGVNEIDTAGKVRKASPPDEAPEPSPEKKGSTKAYSRWVCPGPNRSWRRSLDDGGLPGRAVRAGGHADGCGCWLATAAFRSS